MKTAKRKTKRNPTPAQLRARAKFVKMARARAKAAKKANPGKKGLRGATAKQERQYEAIKRSERRSGRSLKDSKRIAAATVRKRAGNKTIIKARTIKHLDVAKVHNRTRKKRNALPLPATSSSLRQSYDLKTLRAQRDRLRANIQSYQGLTRKLTKELKTTRDAGQAQDLRRRLAEIDRLESREVSILDGVLRRLGYAGTIRKPRRNVEMGYRDSLGRFHPIRASKDYDSGREGRSTRSSKARSSGRKAASTARFRSETRRRRATTSRLAGRALRRNPGVTAKSKATKKLFTGTKSKKTLSLLAPKGAPRSMAILGKLVKVKTRSKTFTPPRKSRRNPEGDIYLAASDSGQLYIVGENLPVVPGPPRDLGEIVEIDYTARKPHLGYDQTTEFFHELGEETGERPHLVTDSEGHLKIVGGEYYIEKDGIHN
jgi:hypothetical protein